MATIHKRKDYPYQIIMNLPKLRYEFSIIFTDQFKVTEHSCKVTYKCCDQRRLEAVCIQLWMAVTWYKPKWSFLTARLVAVHPSQWLIMPYWYLNFMSKTPFRLNVTKDYKFYEKGLGNMTCFIVLRSNRII